MASQTNDHSAMRPSSLRLANAALVLDHLGDGRAASRSELAKRTSLSPQALGAILADLVDSGLVVEQVRETVSPGRPPTEYTLNHLGSFTVSVLVRLGDYFVLIDDAFGSRLATERRRFRPAPTAEPLIESVGDTLLTAIAALGLDLDRLTTLEFATQGTIAEDRSTVTTTLAWEALDVDVAAALEATLGRSMAIVITTNEQAQAMHALDKIAPENNELVAIVHLGVEIRLLLAQGGQLVTNRLGTGGLLTHIPMAGNDRRCPCGARGCLGTVSGAGAMLRSYEELTGVRFDAASEVIDRVRAGDPRAIDAVRISSDWLGRGLGPILGLLEPDRIIFTGGGVGDPRSSGAKRMVDAVRVHLQPPLGERPIDVVAPAFADPTEAATLR